MPALEIIAEQAPKDLDAFLKNLSGLFSECIGKPENVSCCIKRLAMVLILAFKSTAWSLSPR